MDCIILKFLWTLHEVLKFSFLKPPNLEEEYKTFSENDKFDGKNFQRLSVEQLINSVTICFSINII